MQTSSLSIDCISAKCEGKNDLQLLSVVNQTHGEESFLESRQCPRLLKISQSCMEPEGSLQYSQKPADCPYPEPDKDNPHLPILFS